MIQTQQNTFVSFTLFNLTLDERKTLTKISTCKPLTTFPNTVSRGKADFTFCIIGGESRGIRISSRNNERIKTLTREPQDWFRIKLHIIFVPNLLHFYLYGFRNVISIKTLFSTRGNYSKFQLQNSKS